MLNIKYIKLTVISLILTAGVPVVFSVAYSEKTPSLINLTMRINTEGDDYAPSLSADGSTMVFNSRMPQEKSHNIFICKNINGRWGDPYPVFMKPSDWNDETPVITADGNTLIFASDRPGGLLPPLTSDGKKRVTFDLYISRFVNGKWTEPEFLKGAVNTSMNERAPGLSADGKTLFFTRWPYNNPGKSKIYSARLDGGEYIEVKELPENINTGNYEIGFRQSYRSDKYYFASRRAGGLGGWDIYYTTLSGKGFTDPVNAGKEINSPYDDMYYSESKISSVICSDRAGGIGKFDLYSSLPAEKMTSADLKTDDSKTKSTKKANPKKDVKDTKETPQSVLNIKAIDNKTGKLIKNGLFNISVMSERENESVFLRKLKIKTGSKGVFTLSPKDDVDSVLIEPASKSYAGCKVKIRVVKGHVQAITLYIGKKTAPSDRDDSCTEAEIKSTVENKGDESSPVALKAIYFKFGSDRVSEEYMPELHKIVEYMRQNSDYKIVLSGYSDPTGPAKWNDKLSMKRAQNVAGFIKSLGIPEDRVAVEWFGETKPVSGKKGSRYHCLDRKVELQLKK